VETRWIYGAPIGTSDMLFGEADNDSLCEVGGNNYAYYVTGGTGVDCYNGSADAIESDVAYRNSSSCCYLLQ
jgi:hypothetical protein